MDPGEKAEITKEFRKSLGKARMMMAKKMLSKDDVTTLYGLFQQATEGNCNDWKVFKNLNLVDLESKAKFNAWVANRGLGKTEAMERYTTEVDLLATKYCVVFPDSLARGSRVGSVTSLATCSTTVSDDADTVSIASDISLL